MVKILIYNRKGYFLALLALFCLLLCSGCHNSKRPSVTPFVSATPAPVSGQETPGTSVPGETPETPGTSEEVTPSIEPTGDYPNPTTENGTEITPPPPTGTNAVNTTGKTTGATTKTTPAPTPTPTPAATLKWNVRVPTNPGTKVYQDSFCVIDTSNTSEGYIMIKYTGTNTQVRIQVKMGDTLNTYTPTAKGQYDVLPLTSGDGKYTVTVNEYIGAPNRYAKVTSTEIDVKLKSSFIPFLYPSQYVNYKEGSTTVKKGAELALGTKTDLETVANVYNYAIKNIKYDYDKAASITSVDNYLPVPDSTLSSGKGICFDYAVLMVTMLRTQDIPAKLVIGWVKSNNSAGQAYHAWISVYTKEKGWVNNLIQFNGNTWVMMDPTKGVNTSASTGTFITTLSNYSAVHIY